MFRHPIGGDGDDDPNELAKPAPLRRAVSRKLSGPPASAVSARPPGGRPWSSCASMITTLC